MDQLVAALLASVASLGLVGVLLVYFVANPEKFEKWLTLILRGLSKIPIFVKWARRKYVQHDLQSRINTFTRDVAEDAPYLAEQQVEVQWVDAAEITKQAFLADGKVVIRLRAQDEDDMNFVRAAYLFVSTSLLHKAKRYISPTQRDSIDLFVTAKLIEHQKAHVVDYFLEEYLHPKTTREDTKLIECFDCFGRLRESGLFYEIFLQELQFLGAKVFGGRHDTNVHREVNELMSFLERVATRNLGEEGDLEFTGNYCRFGIVIVGRWFKVTPSGEVWTRFIRKHFLPQQLDTVYLVGPGENAEVLDAVAADVAETYDVFRSRHAKVMVFREGEAIEIHQYLKVLRRKGASVFGPTGRRAVPDAGLTTGESRS